LTSPDDALILNGVGIQISAEEAAVCLSRRVKTEHNPITRLLLEGAVMGDKGKKDLAKKNKQDNKKKDTKQAAKVKKQSKP
jgi:hypothetical protein